MEPPSSTICHSVAKEPRARATLRGAQLRRLAPRSVSRRAIVSQLFTSRQVRRHTAWLVSELHLCAAWGRTCSSPRGAHRHISPEVTADVVLHLALVLLLAMLIVWRV
jgi:hypothetical protein